MQDATPVAGMTFETPVDVLNYALTLEHLEYAFYRDGVGLFTFGLYSFIEARYRRLMDG